ncbi:hypothetical protein DPEC_G00150040 [Dallia pectoralis]|uniref:Uncharacterized protein n=1 Tax=Dallia pectoralis TaxID=75939 RepID=A0ACC2GIW4_DALPE|nr:hypothetical protein DPEC_G00150040 [Dallia pectoralis]
MRSTATHEQREAPSVKGIRQHGSRHDIRNSSTGFTAPQPRFRFWSSEEPRDRSTEIPPIGKVKSEHDRRRRRTVTNQRVFTPERHQFSEGKIGMQPRRSRNPIRTL